MKEIELTKGKVAIVDDQDHSALNHFRWYAHRSGSKMYAATTAKNRSLVYMHRIILDAQPGYEVDHENGNGLDNRRCNLRLCRHADNLHNRGPQRNSKSHTKGVWWSERDKLWYAQIQSNGKRKGLGSFKTKGDAARAYNEAALQEHGAFALLNEIETTS